MVEEIVGGDEPAFVKPTIAVTRIGKDGKGYETKSAMSELGNLEAIRRNELRERQRQRAKAEIERRFGDE